MKPTVKEQTKPASFDKALYTPFQEAPQTQLWLTVRAQCFVQNLKVKKATEESIEFMQEESINDH